MENKVYFAHINDDEEGEEYSDANISFLLMDIEIRRSTLQALLRGGKNG